MGCAQQGKTTAIRSIYYKHKVIFKTIARLGHAINKVTQLLDCTKSDLRFDACVSLRVAAVNCPTLSFCSNNTTHTLRAREGESACVCVRASDLNALLCGKRTGHQREVCTHAVF